MSSLSRVDSSDCTLLAQRGKLTPLNRFAKKRRGGKQSASAEQQHAAAEHELP
jgi:hypothetical protein